VATGRTWPDFWGLSFQRTGVWHICAWGAGLRQVAFTEKWQGYSPGGWREGQDQTEKAKETISQVCAPDFSWCRVCRHVRNCFEHLKENSRRIEGKVSVERSELGTSRAVFVSLSVGVQEDDRTSNSISVLSFENVCFVYVFIKLIIY
jgi:hypothetical protein